VDAPKEPTDEKSAKEKDRWEGESGEGEKRELEPLETERDAFTPLTRTLDKGVFVFESAYTFIDNKVGKDKHSYPEALARYGLTDWMELRLGWSTENGGGELDTTGTFVGGGEQTLLYGAKFQITRQEGWRPESALLLEGTTPTGGKTNVSK